MIGPETPVLALLAGVALLIAGRRLFWLFVGLVGFFTVYRWFAPSSGSGRWLIAVLAGLLGIVLAIFLQRLAVALAGFLVGGWFVAGLLGVQLASARGGDLLLMFIAGVIAAVLAVWLFDLALVVLSSIAGADLILEALHPRPGPSRLLLVVLVVVGIAVQLGWTARRREKRHFFPRIGFSFRPFELRAIHNGTSKVCGCGLKISDFFRDGCLFDAGLWAILRKCPIGISALTTAEPRDAIFADKVVYDRGNGALSPQQANAVSSQCALQVRQGAGRRLEPCELATDNRIVCIVLELSRPND